MREETHARLAGEALKGRFWQMGEVALIKAAHGLGHHLGDVNLDAAQMDKLNDIQSRLVRSLRSR